MMYHLIEDAPDGQTIIGQFDTKEQALNTWYEVSPYCNYYITKFVANA